MKRKSATKVSDLAVAEAIIAHEAVDCFCGKYDRSTDSPRRMVSAIGGVFWGKRGETWPRAADGAPLFPWLQIVCTEMEGLYGAFYRRKAVCFYLQQDFAGFDAVSTQDCGEFVVREYSADDDLAPLIRPEGLKGHPFHRVTWEKCEDYPCLSRYYGLFDETVYDSLCEKKNFRFENLSGIKIGGWPTPMQHSRPYPGTYDLQIDMTANYVYGDSGIGFLSREGPQWYLVFETC